MERLDAFMARANAAYYATRDPFADFTTSPEITQVFGEILGLWAAVVWDGMGRPDPVHLVELGPGRGTLMRDACRAVHQVMPGFGAALRLHLVETSPRLRAIQAELLPDATWHDTVDTVPPGPMVLLANEFLDALPIRQFVRREDGWAERFVDGSVFVERPSPNPDPFPKGEGTGKPSPLGKGLGEGLSAAQEGDVLELNEPALALATRIATRLATQGGAALFLDYGPARSAPGDSLQALRASRPADPLAEPGSADLTAHVDFQAFAEAAAGAQVHGPIAQGPFLAALGLFQRSGQLARTQPPARAAALIQAAQRLAEPDRMGGLFKALALCQPGGPTPPGFP